MFICHMEIMIIIIRIHSFALPKLHSFTPHTPFLMFIEYQGLYNMKRNRLPIDYKNIIQPGKGNK